MASATQTGWRDAPDDVEPIVLILGGFITSPPMYLPMRRRLLERGAAGVVIAPVWLPDWLLVPARGMGPILTRSGRALLRAGALSQASPRSAGAPLLVVGHSAGGITARLLTSPEPVAGRPMGAAARIGAIVTLGTPHQVTTTGIAGRRLADTAIDLADRVVPGPTFAPKTGYLTVASSARLGRAGGAPSERVAHRLYTSIHVAAPSATAGEMRGDGLVPLASAGLPGVESIVLEGVAHGQGRTGPWYGSDEALDAWWPRAMAIWHAALRARVESPVL
jgi:hypothetical protein